MRNTPPGPYVPRRAATCRRVTVRGLSYGVREWGPGHAPPMVLLHGARDSSASFQFVVDALKDDWRVVAPDWRGHGASDWTPGSYWLSDFLSDLDALLANLFPGQPLPIVGHSMGGNIAALYAALRPTRVSGLVMLDAMGNTLDRSPVSVAAMLDELRADPARAGNVRTFATTDEMATRLMQADRRLPADRAAYLAASTVRTLATGGLTWANDPTCVRSLPTLHSTAEWAECWGLIQAPVLCLLASNPKPASPTGDPREVQARRAFFRDVTVRTVPDTGHNMHHDAPEVLADAIEDFFRGRSRT